MGFECINLISVTGPRRAVQGFRKDARRRRLRFSTVDLSIDRLFRKHHLKVPARYPGVPLDGGTEEMYRYETSAERMIKWRGFARVIYHFYIKGYEIHDLLVPLSRCYRDLCFVDSQFCGDDSTNISTYVSRGRKLTWDLPEICSDLHWENAAKSNGDAAYDPDGDYDLFDPIRVDAEQGMLSEALTHFDERVFRALRRRH